MIKRANFLLFKAELVRATRTAQLELLTTKSNQVHQLEAEMEASLVEIQSRLAQMAAFDQEELKSQALSRAEENKRSKLFALEKKLKSYERRV